VLNGKLLQVSKNYGLIRTVVLRELPHFLHDSPHTFDIAGMTKPDIGVQNLTWKDVHGGFYPGDELHISEESCYGMMDRYCTISKTIIRYLQRIEYTDYVKYTIERITDTRQIHNNRINSYLFRHDTLNSVFRFYSGGVFNKLSEESVFGDDQVSYNLQESAGNNLRKKTIGLYNNLYKINEQCWTFPISDILIPLEEYIEGLGGPYYWASMWDHTSERQLVYFKKADKTKGTPLLILNETRVHEPQGVDLIVYPNPAHGLLQVRSSADNILFELYDSSGRLIRAEIMGGGVNSLDISQHKAGVYAYRLTKNSKNLKRGVLVIN
jgi:hypothetical protein